MKIFKPYLKKLIEFRKSIGYKKKRFQAVKLGILSKKNENRFYLQLLFLLAMKD